MDDLLEPGLVTKTSLLNLGAKRETRVLDRVKDDNLELEDSQMPRKMDEKVLKNPRASQRC
jgi:hypothetical protein